MIDTNYSKAYKEVLVILNYLTYEDFAKIPQDYIEFFEENSDTDYNFEYNAEKPFEEQELLNNTKYILFDIFEKFGATEKQKTEIKLIREAYNNELEKEKRKKYKPEDIFRNNPEEIVDKNKENISDVNTTVENSLIQTKESVFDKIRKFIKGLFRK